MHAYKGTFTANTATGNQTVTGIVDENGVAFTPKAIFMWSTFGTSTAFSNVLRVSAGMTDGVTSGSAYTASDNNAANMHSAAGLSTALLGMCGTNSSTATRSGAFVSFGSGQFVINWTVQDGIAAIIHFIAFGGSDLSAFEANVREDGIYTNPVNAGFTPTVSLMTQTVVGVGYFGLAWSTALMAGVSQQASTNIAMQSVVNPSVAWRYQRTDRSRTKITNTGAITYDGGIDSIGNYWSISPSNSAIINSVLQLGGIAVSGGSGLQPTSTGTQAISGLGFSPKAVLIMSVGNVANTSAVIDSKLCIGGCDRSRQGYALAAAKSAVSPSTSAVTESTSAFLAAMTPNSTAASSTLDAEAAISSIDSDGFTLNWTTADATQREYVWLAFGDLATAPLAASYGFVG